MDLFDQPPTAELVHEACIKLAAYLDRTQYPNAHMINVMSIALNEAILYMNTASELHLPHSIAVWAHAINYKTQSMGLGRLILEGERLLTL
jgi:hypothetical protein